MSDHPFVRPILTGHDRPQLGEAGFRDTCDICGHALYGGARHICPITPPDSATTADINAHTSHGQYKANVNQHQPVGAKRPQSAQKALTLHYKSEKHIDPRQPPRHFVRHYIAPDWLADKTLRYHKPIPLLSFWQTTYRILAQIPFPGQPLYSNAYNLPI